MISLCYHNGALGHCAMILLECCSREGKGTMPIFYKGKNLHHYQYANNLATVCHPICDITKERKKQHIVLSSTSYSKFGRYLIILMGLYKWNNETPNFNKNVVYKQHGKSIGEQIEILSLTLYDKTNNNDWYIDADVCLDILDYWNNKNNIVRVLEKCKLTPIQSQVEILCKNVAETNQIYFDKIKNCYKIAKDIKENKLYEIDIDFLESAIIHGILLDLTGRDCASFKLLDNYPTSTEDFIRIIR